MPFHVKPMKPIVIIFATLIMAACPGGPYDPCTSVEDCEPALVDGCHHLPDGSGVCTLICRTASDCPKGPEGQEPVCEPYEQVRVCSLP